MNEHYSAVLADLQARRTKLEAELRDVDAAISGIQRIIGDPPHQVMAPFAPLPQSSPQIVRPAQPQPPMPPPHSRFANISVRWGVLWFLAEDARGFVKTGEIASAL